MGPHRYRAVLPAQSRSDCGRVNNGGDMVESTIRMIDPNVSYSAVRASRAFLCPTWGLPVRPGRDGLGFAIDPVYRIETSWPSVGQALTRRLTRCDPLSRTDFMSILQLPFGSSISPNTALPGSKTAEPSRSSCQFSVPSSEA